METHTPPRKMIYHTMLEKDFLTAIQMSSKELSTLLEQMDWNHLTSKEMKKEGDSLCRYAAMQCQMITETLGAISGDTLLWHIYDFIRHVMFPCNFSAVETPGQTKARLFYCQFLRALTAWECSISGFKPTKHFQLLKADEDSCSFPEYNTFLHLLDTQYVVEFMRIASEITPFNTLGHIAGVHYVAMYMADQLSLRKCPINPYLMSAAALLHDIGKFGCRPEEETRVPYLHYYYTDRYTKLFSLPEIGHIAVNHSTWDLELEDLSVENLLLIYADFRVKSSRTSDGREVVHFYSLKDSFDVILKKLDNVDAAKKRRYEAVYARLKDFENYLMNLGISVDYPFLPNSYCTPVEKEYVLLPKTELVQQLKYIAIEHNIEIMSHLSSETKLRNLLETARSEKNFRHLRAYINILEEYFTYLTHKQTFQSLQFLFELLVHSEVDIRRQAASLIGKMIAGYDKSYRKELPEHVNILSQPEQPDGAKIFSLLIHAVLYPDYRMIPQHRIWLGYSLRRIIQAILTSDCMNQHLLIAALLDFYQTTDYDDRNTFILIDAATGLDYALLTTEEILQVCEFCRKCTQPENRSGQVHILQLYRHIVSQQKDLSPIKPYLSVLLETKQPTQCLQEAFLKYRLSQETSIHANINPLISGGQKPDELLSNIFLENLKTNTSGTFKQINIEILKTIVETAPITTIARIATHLSNLLAVSHRLTVREHAGELLVDILRLSSADQRNEMVIELSESLDTADAQYIKYIPKYLGRMALYLHPVEFDELVEDTFAKLINGNNENAVIYTLHTIGVILVHYQEYNETDSLSYQKRKNLLLGYLLRSLSHFNSNIQMEAAYVTARYLFGSETLCLEVKFDFLQYLLKPLISFSKNEENYDLKFYNNAAAFHYIYRFIADYELEHGAMQMKEANKIAFFPGTFDPFTKAHKSIAASLKQLGMEVYLAIDEFSWSKKTQPKLIRRKIAEMSSADLGGIYLFPDSVSVNIANPGDIAKLEQLFPGKEVYIVVGADVIENASAYRNPPCETSVHHCRHVIFTRNKKQLNQKLLSEKIYNETIIIQTDRRYDSISSSRIRENIDLNRDISNLLEPLAQKYIYKNNLYSREPQYKTYVQGSTSTQEDTDILLWHGLENNRLYREFHDFEVIEYIRTHCYGNLCMIEAISDLEHIDEIRLLNVFTDVLAECIQKGYLYCICPVPASAVTLKKILIQQGFVEISSGQKHLQYFIVNMSFPLVLMENMETVIKEPFHTDKRILQVLKTAHQRLQTAMAELYPGNLVLSFHAKSMNQKMLQRITQENHVPDIPVSPRILGDNMCVPYGKILREVVVPNTVTKAIYTEKVYAADASSASIRAYPGYSPLETQIDTLRSFDRPILLADDILHKGDRLKTIYPLLKERQISVKKLIVGILSGHGTDLANLFHIDIDYVYYIPNLKAWFQESMLYPFIGGDMIEAAQENTHLLPSMNLILPYVIPQFLPQISWTQYYNMSLVCLQNAKDILTVLEEQYQNLYQRNLTLDRLNEVIMEPYCVEQGNFMSYDIHKHTSDYVQNDIIRMERLKNLID